MDFMDIDQVTKKQITWIKNIPEFLFKNIIIQWFNSFEKHINYCDTCLFKDSYCVEYRLYLSFKQDTVNE